eukprot:scpid65069/ scgid8433/ C-Jun-amino-terminal kinase-interacting protein 1; Islet-brain 1; JNK MAP kinase scaffold protein 1; Mitogen-activated protein kinase 8-interacting protein 1
MADPPRLAPPPGRGVADVGAQLQQMGLSEGDAQKPLPQDFVWGPEPDDLDAELAMVEKELQQLNELELSMNQAVDVHVGSDPVWAMQQSFEQFPDYTMSDGAIPANYGALATNTAALTMQGGGQQAAGQAAGQGGGAWLEFESPFQASGTHPSSPNPYQQAPMQQPAQAAAPAPAQVTPLPKPSGPVPAQGTHKAVFRFIPRHGDELDMKPGDPIAVQSQAPDLWFSGFNLRTGQSGIFPGHCVGDVKSRGPTQPGPKMKPARFRVRFLGAVQVNSHKGVDLLCAAVQKVMEWRKKRDVGPMKPVVLEISAQGLKMKDISDSDEKYQEERRQSIQKKKNFDVDSDGGIKKFFFPLVSVTFCSCHPKNNRLWAFVSRRKDKVFSCQVFAASQSTQPLTVAMGRAFKQLHTDFVQHATQEARSK